VTRAEIHAAVLKALADVAPEAGQQTIRGDAPFREQVDLDSFDFLRFMIGLHTQLGVDVPERDYPKLGTLNAVVAYLEQKLGIE
jgi:acyl carrier protein